MEIDGHSLTLDAVETLVHSAPKTLTTSPLARQRITVARAAIEGILERGQVVYGINTGFGKLASTRIAPEKLRDLQRNLILSHAAGVGKPLSHEITRLIVLFRANALSRGHSGVRPVVIDHLLRLIACDVLPVIPEQGSVGASGDLAPLAHLALVLIGEGEARLGERILSGREALAHCGLEPIVLEAKEGLALINGTPVSLAIGTVAWLKARRLMELADLATACSIEALMGSIRPFDPRVAAVRPHPGHAETSARVRAYLQGSEILPSHAQCSKVQDPYSLRCVPQVHGAVRDALRHVGEVIERELNAVTDNPLVFADTGEVISAGNFHAEPLAIPFDYAAAAVTELSSISERRIENLVNPDLSGLPPFLVADSGMHSGYMIAQVTAAALVSENKALSHPASVDSIPTSANKEDHVSMAPIAARKLGMIVENAANVLAIEFLSAHQGLALGKGLRPGVGVAAAMDLIGKEVPVWTEDRIMKTDIDKMRRMIDDGSLLAAARSAAGLA